MRKSKDYILLYIKGISMGAANVIPGVSGSSVAFITGIYQPLLYALAAIDKEAFQLLYQFKIADFWKKINGNFLTVLLAGIVTSLLVLAKVMTYLLFHHAILVGAFFFGMILISLPLVMREVKRWNMGAIVSFILGAAIAYAITLLTRFQTPDALWLIFFAGILTTSALMFPGISSSFVLLLMGKFHFMKSAVLQFNFPVVLLFMSGCALGLIGSSRFLSWVLDNYHSAAIALLSGFTLGSLNKLWPWREVFEYITNGKGEQIPVFDKSILPWNYFTITGKDPQVFQAILMMALGVFIVVLIEKIAARLKTKI